MKGCFASRVCFDSLVIRTILPGADRSIVGFGPDCSYIALRDCDLDGISGLLVPRTKVSTLLHAALEGLLEAMQDALLSLSLDKLGRRCWPPGIRNADKRVPCAVQSKSTTLQLHRCYIHGVAHMAAVTMEGGNLRMEGVLLPLNRCKIRICISCQCFLNQ